MARLGHRRDRHLHLVPDPPEFATFTLSELLKLTEADMDQLDALRGKPEGPPCGGNSGDWNGHSERR